jgi:hypothetical protein
MTSEEVLKELIEQVADSQCVLCRTIYDQNLFCLILEYAKTDPNTLVGSGTNFLLEDCANPTIVELVRDYRATG